MTFRALRSHFLWLRGIKRWSVCPACGTRTMQLLHGYTAEGSLWKGHVCLCRGWHCQSCDAVAGKKAPCCR
jgi:hypothetical protein